MRISKALPLVAVLCAIAIAAAVVVVAGAATGPPAINDVATDVRPAVGTGLAPANTLAPANQGVGFCGTGPGQQCAVEWLMTRGTATATAYGSAPGDPSVPGNPITETCSSSTCTKRAVATPSPDVTVEDWIVTGPNITVICAGPPSFC